MLVHKTQKNTEHWWSTETSLRKSIPPRPTCTILRLKPGVGERKSLSKRQNYGHDFKCQRKGCEFTNYLQLSRITALRGCYDSENEI
jgi:hypothetical protein